MIGLDLDGTLLNTKKELTEYTKEILTRAIESGVTILTATGRPYTGIPEELREFPGMRYALTSNGARIIDREKICLLYTSIYVPYVANVMDAYSYDGNPLFVPEVRKDAVTASYALYAFGKHLSLIHI